MDPYVEFAKRHEIPLLEDCAEAFQGLCYTGDPRVDMSFFSFGTIKHATAFGGAVCVVKDLEEAAKMRDLEKQHPTQTRLAYLKKLLPLVPLALLTSNAIVA